MLPVQNLTWLELIYLNHCSKYVYTQRYGSLHSSRVFVLELTDVVAKNQKALAQINRIVFESVFCI